MKKVGHEEGHIWTLVSYAAELANLPPNKLQKLNMDPT